MSAKNVTREMNGRNLAGKEYKLKEGKQRFKVKLLWHLVEYQYIVTPRLTSLLQGSHSNADHAVDSRPSLTSVFNTLVLSPLSSQCPVTCGVGRITRQVDCSNYHQPVDQSFCDPDEKPATEQECAAPPCSSVFHRQRINDQPYGYPQDPGRHPGHSSWNVPSADNQWRTGPWGAVCSARDLWGDRDVQTFSVLW